MGLSRSDLAELLGLAPMNIAYAERHPEKELPPSVDQQLRQFWRELMGSNPERTFGPGPIVLEHGSAGWAVVEAAKELVAA